MQVAVEGQDGDPTIYVEITRDEYKSLMARYKHCTEKENSRAMYKTTQTPEPAKFSNYKAADRFHGQAEDKNDKSSYSKANCPTQKNLQKKNSEKGKLIEAR